MSGLPRAKTTEEAPSEEAGMNPDALIETMQAIRSNPGLTKFQKKMEMAPLLGRANRELVVAEREIAELYRDRDSKTRLIDAIKDIGAALCVDVEGGAWITDVAPLKIQPNDCTRLHKLRDAIKAKSVLVAETLDVGPMPDDVRSFVIAHDWLSIVGDQSDGDVLLPFERCAFEFRVGGRTVIALVQQDGGPIVGSLWFETGGGDWLALGTIDGTAWLKHVRASCIVLDAEVATHEVRRAPHELNVKRIKAGKAPVVDFHLVDLSRRHRVPHSDGSGVGSRKRLHFCRGHWRHYETKKTWIRWCLKGDPAVGIVVKEYIL